MDVVALAHAHLLLNHVPTIGLVFGFGLFLFSLVRRNEELLQASLAALYIVAIMAFPTFMSGYAARLAIRRHAGFSELLTEAHQGTAVMALILMEITGAAAWLGERVPESVRRYLHPPAQLPKLPPGMLPALPGGSPAPAQSVLSAAKAAVLT